MNLLSLSRRLFARAVKSRLNPVRKNPLGRPLEALEDRAVPATFAVQFGVILDLNLAANETATVVSSGASYQVTLAGGNWSGTDSPDVSGNGTATLTVFPSGLAAFDTVIIGDTDVGASVVFADSGANSYSDTFNVVLDEAGAGSIAFNGSTSFSGFEQLLAVTTRDILVNGDISTEDGPLALSGNQSGGSGSGDFIGVNITGSVTTTGGSIQINGRGGDAAGGAQHGVAVFAGASVSAGGTGTVFVQGTGGAVAGDFNYGVYVAGAGAVIESNNGNVQVFGQGGGTGASGTNAGVRLEAGGTISAGGAGKTIVTGDGGTSDGDNNIGVFLDSNGAITSTDGQVIVTGNGGGNGSFNHGVLVDSGAAIGTAGAAAVTVNGTGNSSATGGGSIGVFVTGVNSTIAGQDGLLTVIGQGGGTGTSDLNHGVLVQAAGRITSTGTGSVLVTGTGGTSTGTDNVGVLVNGANSKITSGGGSVGVNGLSGDATSVGVALASSGRIFAGANGTLTITADTLDAAAGTQIGGSSNGTQTIDVSGTGTVSGVIAGAGADFIKEGAGTLTLAGANTYSGTTSLDAGTLLVDGSIDSDTTVNAAGTLGGGGTINGNVDGTGTVAPGASPGQLTINGDFTPAGIVSFEVNPPATAAGTDFDQIVVNGGVDLSGATLDFTGAAGAVTFASKRAIIVNDGGDATAPAAAPADGSTVVIGGNPYRIYYNTGPGGNDVRLIASGTPTTVYVDDGFPTIPGGDIADADLGAAGAQDAVYGLNAFNTIAAAQAAVAANGTIIVNDGAYAEAVSLTGTRTLRIGGPDAAQDVRLDSLATIAGTSVQIVGASALTVGDATDTTLDGPVTGSGSFTKAGTGRLVLNAANTYTGTTIINNGTLEVAGSTTSNTTVNALGTLAGNGTITGNVTGAGTVAPGTSPGILHIVGDFIPLGNVAIEVNPPTAAAGTDFDQITVTGDVDFTNGTFVFSGSAGPVAVSLLATVIDNQSANPTTPGAAPPEGAVVTINGNDYFVFYNGGDGNDVVIVEATTPATVFVNDDWAGLNNGVLISDVDPLAAGPQPGVFGVNAFGDIAPALNAVAIGGTVEVLGSAAAGYGAFTLSNAATFVLVRDTLVPNDVVNQDTVVLNGAVSLDSQNLIASLNQGAGIVNLRTTGGAPITGTTGSPRVTVTTTLANNGSASFGGNVSAVEGISVGDLGTSVDAITLGSVSTGGSGIAAFSNGITTLNANLSTDLGGAVVIVAAGGVRTGASITIDTEQGDDGNGGLVDLTGGSVSSTEAGSNFTIHTGTAFAGGTGGSVALGGFTNDGGHFIQDLTIDTDADVRGDITFGAAAQIGQDLDAAGGTINSNATFTAGAGAANTIDLDATGNVVDNNASAQNFVVPLGTITVDYTTGTVEFDSTTANFAATGDGNLTIRELDALNLQGVSFGATRTFDLTTGAGGTVTQDQSVTGSNFRLTTGGAATLGHANNDLNTVAANVQGVLFFNDADDLTIGTVTGTASTDGITTNGNDLTLQTGGLLTIGDAMGGTDNIAAAGSIVDLNTTAGGVLESNAAAITSNSVRLRGTGTQFNLANANTVSNLAGNTTGGDVSFTNSAALTVGTVALNAVQTDGITTAGRNLTLQTGGLLTIGDAVGGTDNIAAAGAIVDLNTTAGGVLESNAAAVTSNSVRLRGTGAQFSLANANAISTLAGDTTGGAVTFVNTAAMTIGTVDFNAVQTDGIDTDGGHLTLQTGGLLTIGDAAGGTDDITAAGAVVDLNTTAGGVLEANGAAVSSSSLRLRGTGTQFDLANANAVSSLAADTNGGAITFNNGVAALSVGSVTLNAVTTDGVTTAGQNVTLATGALSLSQVVNAGAGTGRFTTAGGVTQAAAITAAALGVQNSGSGNIDLVTAANLIGTFAANTTAGFVDFTNATSLTIGSVAAGTLFTAVSGVTTDGGNISVATTGAGSTLAVNQAVASNDGNIGFDTSDGQTLAANVAADAGDINLAAAANGVNQTAGGVTGADFTLGGAGAFNLNSATNDSTGTLAAGVTGALTFRDATALTVNPVTGVSTNGGNSTLFAGGDFTANNPAVALINAGAGAVRVVAGAGAPANSVTTLLFNTGGLGGTVTLGAPPGSPPDETPGGRQVLQVEPSYNGDIIIHGNNPVVAPGDSLQPLLTNNKFQSLQFFVDAVNGDSIDGRYVVTFNDDSQKTLRFFSIESLGGVSYAGMVVQTGPTTFGIKAAQFQNQQVLIPSLTGQAPPPNPFVVAPSLVNPLNNYTAPTIAIGDVNGDGTPDVVLANGSDSPSLITVLDGKKVFKLGVGTLDLANSANAILGQFYALTDANGLPTFRGGLHVAVRNAGPGLPGEIVVGAGVGGGPIVQTYRVLGGANVQIVNSFFAFESSFRGGVTVATGDMNQDGVDEVIVGTGPGGAPRVQVFNGTQLGLTNPDGTLTVAQMANFFAYDPGFRGGVWVAAGNFDGNGKDDVATAPGFGGGPHVKVFKDGMPVEIASFFAWPPTGPSGLFTSGGAGANGIGSIAFGSVVLGADNLPDPAGRQELLVGSNRGMTAQTKRYRFAPGATSPNFVGDLYTDLGGIQVTDPSTNLLITLPESQLTEGSNVGGTA